MAVAKRLRVGASDVDARILLRQGPGALDGGKIAEALRLTTGAVTGLVDCLGRRPGGCSARGTASTAARSGSNARPGAARSSTRPWPSRTPSWPRRQSSSTTRRSSVPWRSSSARRGHWPSRARHQRRCPRPASPAGGPPRAHLLTARRAACCGSPPGRAARASRGTDQGPLPRELPGPTAGGPGRARQRPSQSTRGFGLFGWGGGVAEIRR